MSHPSRNSFLSLPLPEGIELIEILQQVQQSLRQACQDHAAALRYATLASRDLQGEADARTLVLRSAGCAFSAIPGRPRWRSCAPTHAARWFSCHRPKDCNTASPDRRKFTRIQPS